MRSFLVPLVPFLLLISWLASGCTGSGTPVVEVEEKRDVLRIGYPSEERFERRYAEWLQVEAPDLRYEIVPTGDLLLGLLTPEQWAGEYQADLLFLPSRSFQEFVRQNLLMDLEPFMVSGDVSIAEPVPPVLHLTRLYGNGNLYGLPATFYGQALIFDKDKFDERQMAYPQDLMTWEELIVLASSFEEKGLSLHHPTVAHWILDVGNVMGWDTHDEHGSLAMDTAEWETFLALAREPLRQGIVTFDDINRQVFLSGEHAMALITYDDYLYLEPRMKDHNWDLVTAPVNPARPDIHYHLSVPDFLAIPASSPNAEAALELIALLLSEKTAKWEYRKPYGFSATHPAVFAPDPEKLEAFYKLGESAISRPVPEHAHAEIERLLHEQYGLFAD